MHLEEAAQGTVIDVHVKPKSRQFQVKIEDDELVVLCQEAPVKGRVNRELIKKLSRLFKRRVEIVSGFSSKQKRVLIRDADTEEVRKTLHRELMTDEM